MMIIIIITSKAHIIINDDDDTGVSNLPSSNYCGHACNCSEQITQTPYLPTQFSPLNNCSSPLLLFLWGSYIHRVDHIIQNSHKETICWVFPPTECRHCFATTTKIRLLRERLGLSMRCKCFCYDSQSWMYEKEKASSINNKHFWLWKHLYLYSPREKQEVD